MKKNQLIQLIRNSNLFDDRFYLRQASDYLDTELTLIEHYLEYGAKLGLNPSQNFDTSFYLRNNPDVAQSGINPLIHYLTIGRQTGRLPKSDNLNITEISLKTLPKLIAFYLPQFHPIRENNEWWGKGFTEWTNVTKAQPLFKDHYQPRLPTELGFYDLRLPETREEQAELARSYGIHGFCYYYYWFNGHKLLQRPIEEVLASGKPDFPFCICWANENWSRRWDGSEKEILMAQEHSPESDIRFIHDILPLLRDERYIRVNNRPLILVYRVDILPEPEKTAQRWREECLKNGIGEILLGSCCSFGITDPHAYGFDIAVDFPPHSLWMPPINDQIEDLDPNFEGSIFNYEQCINKTLQEPKADYPRYRAATMAWDNTARRGNNAHIFHGFTPEIYHNWLSQLIQKAEQNAYPFEPVVFINAWNEWAEGTYLEPDRRYGRKLLEVTASALKKAESMLLPSSSPQLQTDSILLTSQSKSVYLPPKISPQDYRNAYSFLFEVKPQLTSSNPEISIVIPVFNKINFTLECLKSLYFHESAYNFEIIVVDDGSSDETESLLSEMPTIRYIRSPLNQGFVGSCNLGASEAQGEYLVFLNNDTTLCDRWLDNLRQTFDNWQNAGLVGSKLIFPNGKMQECGSLIFRDGSAANYGREGDPNHPAHCYARETDYVSGAAIMIKRDLFFELGQFEQCYAPAYYEDVDLAFKVRQQGLKVIVNPHAKVIHHEGGTSGIDTNVGVKKYQVINQQTFYQRWQDVIKNYPERTEQKILSKNHYCSRRILVIDWCIPRPDVDAGSVRLDIMLHILQELDAQVTFANTNLSFEPEYGIPLEKIGIEILRTPYVNSMEEYLKQYGSFFDYVILCRRDFACMYIDIVDKYCPHAQTIFDTVDLHFLRESRQKQLSSSANDDNWWENIRENLKLDQEKNLELELMRRMDTTIVVSPVEKKLLLELIPDTDISIIPTLYHIAPTQSSFEKRDGILFIGYFAHSPNVDAVLWFCREILPILNQNGEYPTINIIGSNPTPEISALASDKIKIHGFVRDVQPFFEQCKLSIAPLRFGAGVKGKINQSMALGLPCVTTTLGAEGMYLIDGENVLLADEPKTFATKIKQLYHDQDLWLKLRQGGFQNIEDHFSAKSAKITLAQMLDIARANLEKNNYQLNFSQRNKNDYYTYLERGKLALISRNIKEAAELFLQAIKIDPERHDGINFLRLCFYYYAQNKNLLSTYEVEKITNELKQIIKNNSEFHLPYLALGNIFKSQGKDEEALTYSQQGSNKIAEKNNLYSSLIKLTNQQKRTPNFMIIGAPKSGTTSLYQYLVKHPKVLPALTKEINYFSPFTTDQDCTQIDWYLSHFPELVENDYFVTGEATPTYLYSHQILAKISQLFPEIKIMIILRNPAERAISHLTIIIHHHHIYKNAGTTIDWILNHNFPNQVLNIEGETPGARLSADKIKKTIQSYPEHLATSSHSTPLIHPEEKWAMFHITMLRHPIKRLYSMYRYDLTCQNENPSKIIASNSDFAGYCQWWLERKYSISINWQTRCCTPQSWIKQEKGRIGWDADLESASNAINNTAFCGIVERFDESMLLLEHYINQAGINFNGAYLRQNTTRKEDNTEKSELQEIKSLLGDNLYNQLVEINDLDFKLFNMAEEKLNKKISQIDPNGNKLKEFQQRCLKVKELPSAQKVRNSNPEDWIIVKD